MGHHQEHKLPLEGPREACHARLDRLREALEAAARQGVVDAFEGATIDVRREIEGDGDYELTIRVDRGARVGAEVELEWERGEGVVEVDVRASSTVERTLIGALVGGGTLLGMALALFGAPPFAMIPSRTLRALAGAFAGLVVGMVAFAVARPFAMAGTADENEELYRALADAVSPALEAFRAERARAS